ncbi:ATP-binding protein [Silvibacterium acidisoli]|uniref:ATP-binding protein n=1 Tax=Acidobacteriaceae bacterium ZG23-2 TaxID=2883246 RepID=UPI00406C723D
MSDKGKHTTTLRSTLAAYGVLTLLALAITGVCFKLLHVNQTTVALAFLVAILVVAWRWRLSYSIYLSVLSCCLYNVFFLPPLGTLVVGDPQNLVALLVFLCTSVLVSHLAESQRREAQISRKRQSEVEQLYQFSQELLLHDEAGSFARVTPSIAAQIFGFSAVALYVVEGDAAYYSDPKNELLPAIELKRAAHVAEPIPSAVDEVQLVPLVLGMKTMGVLAFHGGDVPREMYEAIASLVSIALERTAALERSSHLEAARESERLHSALLDSVTHELRTPLTSIRAAATMLVSQPGMLEGERQEMYAVLDEESLRLNRLIGQAIEMARLDTSRIHVEAQPENVREVILLALEEARNLLADRHVTVEAPENLPMIAFDRKLVGRVLHHLLENAVKYSPAGSALHISASVDGYRLLVSVKDHGQGIEGSEQSLIFNRFYRGHNRKPGVSGTGMGLAIVKAIMIAHGGGIEVSSEPQQGAEFTFWLPVRGRM